MPIFAVSGASSTGKTTLLNLIRVYSSCNLTVTPEFVKIFAKLKGVELRELYKNAEEAFLFQLNLYKFLFQEFQEMKNSKLIVVSDRCPLDSLVYLMMAYERLDDELKEFYQDELEEYQLKYIELTNEAIDSIFLTTATESDPIEDDGERLLLSASDRLTEIKYFLEVFSDDRLTVPKYALPSSTPNRLFVIYDEFFKNKIPW